MKNKARKARSPAGNERGTIAEFGPALFLFFAFIVVPVLCMIRFGLSTAVIYFIVERAADRASKSYSYDSALCKANEAVDGLFNTPIARFAGLKPERVSDVCLLVDEHKTKSDTSNVLTRDDLVRKAISPEINTYEYEVRSSYTLDPILPSNLPWLGKVPLLSAPAKITVVAIRPVEYPDGLNLRHQMQY